MNELTLLIVTPEGEQVRIQCGSVTLYARDNARGEGGGSIGIRKGHLPALISLKAGSAVKARTDGRDAVVGTVSGGFASVRNNTVTVAAEGFSPCGERENQC